MVAKINLKIYLHLVINIQSCPFKSIRERIHKSISNFYNQFIANDNTSLPHLNEIISTKIVSTNSLPTIQMDKPTEKAIQAIFLTLW